jgi:hypothetical protein
VELEKVFLLADGGVCEHRDIGHGLRRFRKARSLLSDDYNFRTPIIAGPVSPDRHAGTGKPARITPCGSREAVGGPPATAGSRACGLVEAKIAGNQSGAGDFEVVHGDKRVFSHLRGSWG